MDDPKTLEHIRHTIQAQKAGYWNQNPFGRYGKAYDIFAYLSYQFPVYLIQFRYLIARLDAKGLLPDTIHLLDLGSGPGVVPLALVWYMKERNRGSLSIRVMEQSEEFLESYRFLMQEFSKGMRGIDSETIYHGDIRSPVIPFQDTVTLITLQNVLAEFPDMTIQEKTDLIMRYIPSLSDDGLLLIVEPAEYRHSTNLRSLQRSLEMKGLHVYGPCRSILGSACRPDNCWSFSELKPIHPTRMMALLAGQEMYRYCNTDIKFSYLILTKQRMDMTDRITLPYHTRLSDLKGEEGAWVTIIAAKMSPDIGDRNYAVFLLCDRSGAGKTYLVIPRSLHQRGLEPVFSADYGDILLVQSARVRWNQKKKAYNLITGMRTSISAMNI